MLKQFINRPVLSTTISILITILGVLGLTSLPIEQYPDIAPPTVKVTANYTGANAETVLKSVVIPLEEEINGVEGMSYISSTASNDGRATINVYFDIGVDPDIATVNVQNRVSAANSSLPSEVISSGITTAKTQSSALMFISFFSNTDDYDDVFIQNYVNINVVPKLQRVKGVGEVNLLGTKDYAIRVWLKPDKLAQFNLNPSDVLSAISEQNTEAAVGKFGENSNGVYEYVIKYKGRLSEVEEYEQIIVKTNNDGGFLRLKDVADVELGGYSYANNNFGMGQPGAVFGIFQTSGSNARDIISEVEEILDQVRADLPEGIDFVIPMNTDTFLSASIEKVVKTLIEAFILVFIVVFVFLQDFRSTLIPIIAVPVAIIGTFFFLNLFGYSINLLTLFALVLAIGIVVDDAIVVVEAVHVKLDGGGLSAKDASINAMSEITSAIISITLVMAAVFVPVTFMSGSSGIFYQQFAITLTIAIIISAVNALTLSPALCALLLIPHSNVESHKKGIKYRLSTAFNTAFDSLTNKYTKVVQFLLNRKLIVVSALLLISLWTVQLFKSTPTGFIPTEDQGTIMVDVSLAPGSTLKETKKVVHQLDSIIADMDLVRVRMNVVGYSRLNGINGSSYAFTVIKLKMWEDRTEENQTVQAVIAELNQKVKIIKNANILFFIPPTVRGFGTAEGFEFKLQDKMDGEWSALSQVSDEFLGTLNDRPEIKYVRTSFNPNFPQYQLNVDLEQVKYHHLDLSDVFSAMQGYYGGVYNSDFNRFGKQFKVMVQAYPEYRDTKETLDEIFIRNSNNEMVSLGQLVSLERIYGPESVSRYNLLKALTVNGEAADGFSTGDAIEAVKEVATQVLPSNYTYEFSGMTREEIKASGQSTIIFALSIIFVYFLLSAQYESYILPFSVLLSLPMGVFGAIGFVKLTGLENNIYFQVALIMLLGLLAKNAILIVEFALQRRRQGMSITQAAWEGAKARLRPILMTSFAFILGLFPLVFASGVGL